MFRKQLNYPNLKRAVIQQYRRYRPTKVLIEEKSSGIPLLQELKAEGIFGIEPYKTLPGADKLMRLGAQSIKFEHGQVLLPSQAPWLDEYIFEITGFPRGQV